MYKTYFLFFFLCLFQQPQRVHLWKRSGIFFDALSTSTSNNIHSPTVLWAPHQKQQISDSVVALLSQHALYSDYAALRPL